METFALSLLVVLGTASLTAAFLVLRAFFPRRVDQVQRVLEHHWNRAFWLGLVNTLFTAVLLLGLAALGDQMGIFFLPAFALAGAFLVVVLFGWTASARLLGIRLLPERKPILQELSGGLILLLSTLAPVVGWFLFLPYLIFMAVGAVVLAYFQNRKQNIPQSNQES